MHEKGANLTVRPFVFPPIATHAIRPTLFGSAYAAAVAAFFIVSECVSFAIA